MKTTTPCDGNCGCADMHDAHLTRRYRIWLWLRYGVGRS